MSRLIWICAVCKCLLLSPVAVKELKTCGYSEAPHRGASNDYPQYMFLWRNKKNINTFGVKKKKALLVICNGIPIFSVNTVLFIPKKQLQLWFGYRFFTFLRREFLPSLSDQIHHFRHIDVIYICTAALHLLEVLPSLEVLVVWNVSQLITPH